MSTDDVGVVEKRVIWSRWKNRAGEVHLYPLLENVYTPGERTDHTLYGFDCECNPLLRLDDLVICHKVMP